MSRDCCKQGFSVNEHEGVWELLRAGTITPLYPMWCRNWNKHLIKARGFPMCPRENLGLWTSKENLSFLGLKQENYTKLLLRVTSVWGHGENPEPRSADVIGVFISIHNITESWDDPDLHHSWECCHRNEPMHRASKRKFYGRFYTHTQIF